MPTCQLERFTGVKLLQAYPQTCKRTTKEPVYVSHAQVWCNSPAGMHLQALRTITHLRCRHQCWFLVTQQGKIFSVHNAILQSRAYDGKSKFYRIHRTPIIQSAQ